MNHRLTGSIAALLFALGAAARAEEAVAPKISWKRGETTVRFQHAALNLSNRLQLRFTETDPDAGEKASEFEVRRARTKLDGWIFREELTFELQVEWTSVEAPDPPQLDARPLDTRPLLDAYLNWDLSGREALQLRAGQFKVPFGRQELTSSGRQQFVDRSITSNEFAQGRDLGVQLWGRLGDSYLEYRAGVFNGEGKNQSRNEDGAYQYDGRLMFQPFGDVGYSEGDFESQDQPLLALAANVELSDQRGEPGGRGLARTVYGVDAAFKFRGFSVVAEAFQRNSERRSGERFDSDGWHVQAGLFLIPDRLEIAGRYATLDPSDLRPTDEQREVGVALNVFFDRHPFKLQGEYRRLDDEARQIRDHEARVQLQFTF